MTIGENIKKWRRSRDVTQKELSSALGITQAALSLYEKGLRRIDAETLGDIAMLLDVPIQEMFKNLKQ